MKPFELNRIDICRVRKDWREYRVPGVLQLCSKPPIVVTKLQVTEPTEVEITLFKQSRYSFRMHFTFLTNAHIF